MFLLIDNYDSFTYNLVQAFIGLGKPPIVMTNDDPKLLDMATDKSLKMVCISPGPSNPNNAGQCLEFLNRLPQHIPVLGVCLGHQILGAFAGATVEVGFRVMHGKQSEIQHNSKGMFSGLPNPLVVGRYHSLIVKGEGKKHPFTVTARTKEGEIMGLQYNSRPWAGVQFHPESILTPEGVQLLKKFPNSLIDEKPSTYVESEVFLQSQKTPIQMSGIMDSLAQKKDLSVEEAHTAFTRLMEGELTPSQAGALLIGLRAKGETPEEVSEAVKAVLAKAVPIPPVSFNAIDIVGTGGDSKGSFNCSTATSLTLAGMGYKVLKHGNRSVSSRSGSADVLEEMGIPLDTQPEKVAEELEKNGFVFLFAPHYHPAFRHVMPIRRELGIRTVFNILGPLVNPARPSHHLLGVADPSQLSLVAETLARDEKNIGVVVHGAGGYDELTTLGKAQIIFVNNGKTRKATLDPASFNFHQYKEEELTVKSPEHAAQVLRELLQGNGCDAMKEMLAFNVGIGIYILKDGEEKIDPLLGYDRQRMKDSIKKAREAVSNGAGKRFCYA